MSFKNENKTIDHTFDAASIVSSTHLVSHIISSGDQAVSPEVLPRLDRETSFTAEAAQVAAERQFLHGQLPVELAFGGYAQPVGERRARGHRLRWRKTRRYRK